jgi:DNA-binding MarR family transcriptional regulator
MTEMTTPHRDAAEPYGANQRGGDGMVDGSLDLRHLADQLQTVLVQLTQSGQPAPRLPEELRRAVGPALDVAQLQAMVRFRRQRDAILGAELFGEPVWEMLLDLLIARLLGKRVAVSSLCIASQAPESTALRHIQRMIKAGLVDKVDDPSDGRRSLIMLSREGYRKLGQLFGAR